LHFGGKQFLLPNCDGGREVNHLTDVISTKYCFYNEVPIPEHLKKMLNPKESALFAVKTLRDVAVFTNKRILIADKQGITGKKIEYCTIPYKSIVVYSVETAGTFDLDAEIKLVLSGGIRIELQFFKDKNMRELLFKVNDTITEFVL